MQLEFPLATFQAVKKAGAKSEVFRSDIDYDSDVDSRHILPADYALIRKAIGDPKTATTENKRILRKLDALEPRVIVDLIETFITGLQDKGIWREDLRRMKSEKDLLAKASDRWAMISMRITEEEDES